MSRGRWDLRTLTASSHKSVAKSPDSVKIPKGRAAGESVLDLRPLKTSVPRPFRFCLRKQTGACCQQVGSSGGEVGRNAI